MARRSSMFMSHSYAAAAESSYRQLAVAEINATQDPARKAELEQQLKAWEDKKAQEEKQRALTIGLPFPVALDVPYAQRQSAKALGCQWDGFQKKWMTPPNKPLSLFSKWLPDYYKTAA